MNELTEKIGELIDKERMEDDFLIRSFFDILFWKNWGAGYLKIEDKQNILSKIKECSSREYEEYKTLDTERILPFINEIRKSIGLPELIIENGSLLELTDEVKKRLIVKGLK